MEGEAAGTASRGIRLQHIGERVMHEPALLLSVAYLTTSALGLWASYWFYLPFGIPIFEYMQPSDLLVAGLRDPAYLLLVLLGIALIWLQRRYEDYRFGHPERLARLRRHWWARIFVVPRWRERMARNKDTWWRSAVRLVAVPYVALWLVFAYVQWQAQDLAAGRGTVVELAYAGDGEVQPGHPLLLGTTANWVFVYWPARHRAEAIAQQSLRGLAYPPLSPPH